MENSRLKRLIYRSVHRGCKETDLVLGPFAETRLAALTPPMVDVYEQLLEESDADIWNWLTGKIKPPEEYVLLLQVMKEESA